MKRGNAAPAKDRIVAVHANDEAAYNVYVSSRYD
jgi:hypothetical protein